MNTFITLSISFNIKSEHLPTITADSFCAIFLINSDSFINSSSELESSPATTLSRFAPNVLSCSFSSIYSSDNPVSLANFITKSLS